MGAETRRAERQNQTQIDVNNANIQAQREENQKDRDFQRSQWEREFAAQTEFQRNFWKEQFEAENAYNTPTAQVARLQAAGINPAALVSQISGVSSAAASPSSSSPSPSSSSGGHGLSGSIPSALPMSTDAALFSSLAQLNDSLNNAAKVGLQANEQNVMLQRNAANVAADTNVKQQAAQQLNLQNSITATFGKDKMAAEIQERLNHIEVLKSQKNYTDAQTAYQELMSDIGKQQFNYNKDAFPIMLNNLERYGDTLDAEADSYRASAYESREEGKLAKEKASTESTMREVNKNIAKETLQKIKNETGITAQALANGVREAMVAEDQNEFWKSHPSLRNAVSIACNASESFWKFLTGNGVFLKGIIDMNK